jgi:hypothetical protein
MKTIVSKERRTKECKHKIRVVVVALHVIPFDVHLVALVPGQSAGYKQREQNMTACR